MDSTTPTTPTTPPATRLATPSEPGTPRKRLTRDDRRDILIMRKLGYTYSYIANFLKVSERAVRYTLETQKATLQYARAGRPPRLNKEEVDQLEAFVVSSHRTRRLTWL